MKWHHSGFSKSRADWQFCHFSMANGELRPLEKLEYISGSGSKNFLEQWS